MIIKNDRELEDAIMEIGHLFNVRPHEKLWERRMALDEAIYDYEEEHINIEPPTEEEMCEFRADQEKEVTAKTTLDYEKVVEIISVFTRSGCCNQCTLIHGCDGPSFFEESRKKGRDECARTVCSYLSVDNTRD